MKHARRAGQRTGSVSPAKSDGGRLEADWEGLHAPQRRGVERCVCVCVSHIPMAYKVSHHHQAVTPTTIVMWWRTLYVTGSWKDIRSWVRLGKLLAIGKSGRTMQHNVPRRWRDRGGRESVARGSARTTRPTRGVRHRSAGSYFAGGRVVISTFGRRRRTDTETYEYGDVRGRMEGKGLSTVQGHQGSG